VIRSISPGTPITRRRPIAWRRPFRRSDRQSAGSPRSCLLGWATVAAKMTDYIRANRDRYSREAIRAQLIAAGHDSAAIDAAS